MKNMGDTAPKAITVRIPREQLRRLSDYAAFRGASLNSIVAEAIAQYEVRIDRELAMGEIRALQTRLRDERAGAVGTDSAALLREIREARASAHASRTAGADSPGGDPSGGTHSSLRGRADGGEAQ